MDMECIEAFAALAAIQFALDLRLHHIILEGDSVLIIRALQSSSESLASFGHFVEQAKSVQNFTGKNFILAPKFLPKSITSSHGSLSLLLSLCLSLSHRINYSYYPLGSLKSIVNPVEATMATEDMGAGRFTLNISTVNGSVAIDIGIIQASVTQTVFDQNPVAIFGVSRVLLLREIFGKNPIVDIADGGAQSPDVSLSPENLPELYVSPSHLLSPLGQEIQYEAAGNGIQRFVLALCCIALYL
ncbi:fasciclin-like arabinogalactan protein 4 [Camellia sinensis]|uniref:fasciclin-like arabinogalactan protein 4 n=1 Tax=Camellia sinensis TaxID=4442 RepID=UPI00103616FD|nr:fasciclin-like arabinogalactan protein 4 [Camellia sinensis]